MNGMGLFTAFVGLAGQAMIDADAGREKFKARVRERWEASKKMPRKMKKRERKELLELWQLAHYDPMKEMMGNWGKS